MKWFWLSFVDSHQPEGHRFRGVVIVSVEDGDPVLKEPRDPKHRPLAAAHAKAQRLGLNPGGEILGIELPTEMVPDASYHNRLLVLREVQEIGIRLPPSGIPLP